MLASPAPGRPHALAHKEIKQESVFSDLGDDDGFDADFDFDTEARPGPASTLSLAPAYAARSDGWDAIVKDLDDLVADSDNEDNVDISSPIRSLARSGTKPHTVADKDAPCAPGSTSALAFQVAPASPASNTMPLPRAQSPAARSIHHIPPSSLSTSSSMSSLHSFGRRYLQSPIPSSNASVVASESDDEGFDDIEFPTNPNGLMLRTVRTKPIHSPDPFDEMDAETTHPSSDSNNTITTEPTRVSATDDATHSQSIIAPSPLLASTSRFDVRAGTSHLVAKFSDDHLFDEPDVGFELPGNGDDQLAARLQARLLAVGMNAASANIPAAALEFHPPRQSATPSSPSVDSRSSRGSSPRPHSRRSTATSHRTKAQSQPLSRSAQQHHHQRHTPSQLQSTRMESSSSSGTSSDNRPPSSTSSQLSISTQITNTLSMQRSRNLMPSRPPHIASRPPSASLVHHSSQNAEHVQQRNSSALAAQSCSKNGGITRPQSSTSNGMHRVGSNSGSIAHPSTLSTVPRSTIAPGSRKHTSSALNGSNAGSSTLAPMRTRPQSASTLASSSGLPASSAASRKPMSWEASLRSSSGPYTTASQHTRRSSNSTNNSNTSNMPAASGSATNNGTRMLRKPRTTGHEGDGTELDNIEDLPVENCPPRRLSTASAPTIASAAKAKRNNTPNDDRNTSASISSSSSSSSSHTTNASKPPSRPPLQRVAFGRTIGPIEIRSQGVLGMGGVPHYRGSSKPPTSTSRDTASSSYSGFKSNSKKKREPKKPTLIKNLGAVDAIKVVGDMVYNPVLQIWEGNESVLSDFDRTPTTPTRPALIKNLGNGMIPERIGAMVFDPKRMCWVGNEEEASVFADIEDDTTTSNEPANCAAFTLTKSLQESLCIAEASHKLFLGQWYPRAMHENRSTMRDMNKTYLYEIRTILGH